MKRLLVLTVAVWMVCLCLTGCSLFQSASDDEQGEDKDRLQERESVQRIDEAKMADLNALRTLLPEQEGYQWLYQGFAEFGAVLTLEEIKDTGLRVEYVVRGEVDDVSSGESSKDFNVLITYVIEDSRLRQIKQEEVMLESEFDEVTLIATPLKTGTAWTETVVDKSGQEVVIRGEIVGVSSEPPYVFSVRYESVDGDHWEERMIKQGIGVVSFQRSMTLQGETFELGYSLWEEMSGYTK